MARVNVHGGPHNGTYEMQTTSCQVVADTAGTFLLTMQDRSAASNSARIQNLVVGGISAKEASAGTPYFRFDIGFGGNVPPYMPAIRYRKTNRAQPPGPGTLVFRDTGDMVNAFFSGPTTDGGDSVKINGTISCKADTRAP
jgi:hypothetical protein